MRIFVRYALCKQIRNTERNGKMFKIHEYTGFNVFFRLCPRRHENVDTSGKSRIQDRSPLGTMKMSQKCLVNKFGIVFFFNFSVNSLSPLLFSRFGGRLGRIALEYSTRQRSFPSRLFRTRTLRLSTKRKGKRTRGRVENVRRGNSRDSFLRNRCRSENRGPAAKAV